MSIDIWNGIKPSKETPESLRDFIPFSENDIALGDRKLWQ